MTTGTLGDVGGWFRSASDEGATLADRPGWGPGTGGFDLRSPDDVVAEALDAIHDRRLMVLTGAGMSTGSGLPDYRGRHARPRAPMLYQEFVGSDVSRRRYWARSTVGWPHFLRARPGLAHRSLAELAQPPDVAGVVTQNVARLHQRAGCRDVVDLHGRLDHVICLGCHAVSSRVAMQETLLALNEAFLAEVSAEAEQAPDGDAAVERTGGFRYPDCERCGGMLKPDVVFFGENAHKEAVADAFAVLERSEAVLVLGSSLTVMSGLRFCRRAAREGKPVVIVGEGFTRGDELATQRVHGLLEDVLPRWLASLTP